MKHGGADADVLVIGAGIAGLVTARLLAESGLKVVIVEARNRVGGRIFTERTPEGVLVEHGAEFVHGKPEALWALLQEAGIVTTERGGNMAEAVSGHGVRPMQDEGDEDFRDLGHLADLPEEDMSFAEWLDAEGDSMPVEQRKLMTGYVEGFNAADAQRISARSLGVQQRADDAIEGDRGWHLSGGYAQLPEYLRGRVEAAGGDVRLGCEVFAIHWRRGQVVLSTRLGDLRAAQAVLTLPLGVLHAANAGARGSVRIEPEPRPLFEARSLEMGHVVRFTMVFRERWWEQGRGDLRTMSFLFTRDHTVPVWWTRHPEQETLPTLVGWAGGPQCTPLQGLSAERLGVLACEELAAAFGMEAEAVRSYLIGTYTLDWAADPFSKGAYSYVPAGALDVPRAMTEPVENTLYFAGEHTDTTGHWGTVHAALGSGLRAAGQVLEHRNLRKPL